jgi:hypothetical protein
VIGIDIDKVGVRAPPETSEYQPRPPPPPQQAQLDSDEAVGAGRNQSLPGPERCQTNNGAEREVAISGIILNDSPPLISPIGIPASHIDHDVNITISKKEALTTTMTTHTVVDGMSSSSATGRNFLPMTDFLSTTTSSVATKPKHFILRADYCEGSCSLLSMDKDLDNNSRRTAGSPPKETTITSIANEILSQKLPFRGALALATQNIIDVGGVITLTAGLATNPRTDSQGTLTISAGPPQPTKSQQSQQPAVPAILASECNHPSKMQWVITTR